MATNRLQVRLDAVDNTKKAFSSIKSSIFNLRNALAGLGVGLITKQFIDTGRSVEDLNVRLKQLFGSTQEGAKAFDVMRKFASRVPFSLEEIQAASGNLAVVAGDADRLSDILKITGNVAAVTGLDFRTAGEQIQRSFAGGIAAADIFREKGVRDMLGFKAGATVSAEETVKAFEKVFGKGGRFGNATAELANTFTGTLSMIGDKLFSFKKDVADAGFFEAFKTEIQVLDMALAENEKTLKEVAKVIGETLAKAVHATGDAIRFVAQYTEELKIAFQGLILLGVASVIAKITEGFYALATSINVATGSLKLFNLASAGLRKLLGAFTALFSLSAANKKFLDSLKDLQEVFEDEFLPEDIGGAVDVDAILNPKKAKEAMGFLERIRYEFKQLFDTISAETVTKGVIDNLSKQFEEINKTIATGITKGIQSMSRGLAEAVVLGKNLQETFRAIAQKLLVNILAKTIEFVTLKTLEFLYEKYITREKEKQLGLMKTMAALQRATSIGSFFGNIFGRIAGTTTSTGIDTTVISPFAEGGNIKAGQAAMVGERGRELFIPNTDGRIIKNEDLGMGGANITFNVNAVDVRGVRELLIENRSTITNLINQALNQQGRKALV